MISARCYLVIVAFNGSALYLYDGVVVVVVVMVGFSLAFSWRTNAIIICNIVGTLRERVSARKLTEQNKKKKKIKPRDHIK